MNKKPFYLMVLALCFPACKTTETHTVAPEEQEEKIEQKETHAPKVIDEPTLSEQPQEPREQPVVAELTSEQKQKIFKALGCPEEAITETGCKQCPSAVEYWTSAPRDEYSPEVTIKLEQGVFSSTHTGREQVLASFGDCQELPAGQYYFQELAHLTEQEDGNWTLHASVSVADPQKCEQIKVSDTLTHTLCTTYRGRMGSYEMAMEAYSWDKTTSSGAESYPTTTTILTALEYDSCGSNLVIGNDIKRKVEDIDGDGLNDLSFTITHIEGPWTGDQSECMDGDYEGEELTPKRDKKTTSHTYTYIAIPEGYKEQNGKTAFIPHSAEFDGFF